MTEVMRHPASFRDPAGFVFEFEGKLYRQVNRRYAASYDLLNTSGLYEELVQAKLLLPHEELDKNLAGGPEWYKTLLPEQLPFISYPWEWCFGQWKEAALLTLDLVRRSVARGMILKDATPFNVQFIGSRAVFIDTLSFDKYTPDEPWIAYRQFTECFLAPLLLARYRSQELPALFQLYPQGIPLSLLAKLLPGKSKLNLHLYLHVHLPAKVRPRAAGGGAEKKHALSRQKLLSIIDSLTSLVRSLVLPASASTWNNYYEETVLSQSYVEEKKAVVGQWLAQSGATTVLDIGTNTGLFAQMAAAGGAFTIAADADVACINLLYDDCRAQSIPRLLPLRIDITNPSPATGWANAEQSAFLQRAKADLALALALVHHLAIGRNIGFGQMAAMFAAMSPRLIIEFVPKTDPRTKLLLEHREDIFDDYNEVAFTAAFSQYYTVQERTVLPDSGRILFLMHKK